MNTALDLLQRQPIGIDTHLHPPLALKKFTLLGAEGRLIGRILIGRFLIDRWHQGRVDPLGDEWRREQQTEQQPTKT